MGTSNRELYKMFVSDWAYYGSTTKTLAHRKGNHIWELRNNCHKNKAIQKWYDNGGNIKDIQIISLGYGSKIDERNLILENECVNERNPFPKNTKEYEREYHKLYNKNYDRKGWNHSPKGKANEAVDNAKKQIKKYTKEKRWDMVEKWNERLKIRIENRAVV